MQTRTAFDNRPNSLQCAACERRAAQNFERARWLDAEALASIPYAHSVAGDPLKDLLGLLGIHDYATNGTKEVAVVAGLLTNIVLARLPLPPRIGQSGALFCRSTTFTPNGQRSLQCAHDGLLYCWAKSAAKHGETCMSSPTPPLSTRGSSTWQQFTVEHRRSRGNRCQLY